MRCEAMIPNPPRSLRHTDARPLDHMVLLATVCRVPEESNKILIKQAMNALRQDIHPHHIHGEAREVSADKDRFTNLGSEPPRMLLAPPAGRIHSAEFSSQTSTPQIRYGERSQLAVQVVRNPLFFCEKNREFIP